MKLHSYDLGSEGFLNRSQYLSFGVRLGCAQNIREDCSSGINFIDKGLLLS